MKISRIMFTHFIVIFVLCIYDTSYAGPFGTEMGDTPSKFTGLTADIINNYEQVFSTSKMPKTHSQFVKYELTFRSNGLCKIRAFSHKYTNDKCSETLEIYNALKRQLSSKYKDPSSSEIVPE